MYNNNMKLIPDTIMNKDQFLVEHNRLSPDNLKATFAMLTHFQEEKRPLLKDAEWSNKLRIPFISWLTASSTKTVSKKKTEKRPKKQVYKIYPRVD